MSDSPTQIRLRDLPAYIFDLLPEQEAAALREALEDRHDAQEVLTRLKARLSTWDPARHPSHRDLAQLAAGDSWEVTEHLLSCRDCAFELGVLAAELKDSREAGPPRRPFPRLSRLLPAAAALVVGAGLFWAGGRLGPEPEIMSSAVPVRLESSRGDGSVDVDVSRLRGRPVAFLVQAPIPPGSASWELRLGSERLAGGELSLAPGPHLRDLVLLVPGDVVLGPGNYRLVVTGPQGEVIREWEVSVHQS